MDQFSIGLIPYIIQPGDHYGMIAERYQLTLQDLYRANPWVNPNQLFVGQRILIPIHHSKRQNEQDCITQSEVELMRDQRSLWEEHVAWTRMAIISLIFKLPDVDFVLARLLKNATDMGEMIRPLYGDAAANTYSALIKEHLLIAADLVKAALAGDNQAAMTAERKWYKNADEIAVFLNSVNRFLPVEKVRDMFYQHLNLTKQEAVFMMNMDYQKDIDIYDEIEKQAREMADMISDAMIKLYPNLER